MNNGLGSTEDQDLLRHLIRTTSPTPTSSIDVVGDITPRRPSISDVSELGRKKLEGYTASSPYRFNQDVQAHMLATPDSSQDIPSWQDKMTRSSGRDLGKEAARQVWDTLPADTSEQTKNLFIGIVQQEVDKLNIPSTTEWFQRSIGTPDGEANLVAEFQDYVVSNPSASADLKKWYEDVGILELKPTLSTAQDAPQIPTYLSQSSYDFAEALKKDFEADGVSPLRSFIRSYLDDNKLTNTSGTGTGHRIDVVRHINNHFSKYKDRDQITNNELRSVRANVISSLQQYGEGDTNYYLVAVNPSELNAIKNAGPLKSLSADDFMQALLVTPQELTSVDRVYDIQEKWTKAGLNAQQQVALKYALLHGSTATTSGVIYQMAKDGDEKASAEKRVYEWLDEEEARRARAGLPWPPSDPLVLPSNLHNEHITSEFLILNGIKPLNEKNIFRKGLSWIYDKAKAGFGGLIAADEKVIDDIAESALSDPSIAIGRGVEWDPFKEQTRRITFPGTSLPFIGRLIPTHKEINKSIEDARKNGASDETLNAMKVAQAMTYAERAVSDTLYSYAEGTWDNIRGKVDGLFNFVNPFRDVNVKKAIPTIEQISWTTQRLVDYVPGWETALDKYPELKKFGPLASYNTVRLSMLREDSRPKGSIRTDLTNIYVAANEEEKHELEDAISGLFEYDIDANKRWYLANALEFTDLVINKNYSISEALDEALTAGSRMRAGFAYGNFNLLDWFGGAVAKPIKAGVMGLRRTPRIMDTMGTPQLLNMLKNSPSALDISNKQQTEALIAEIDTALMAGQRNLDVLLDKATTVPVSRLRTSLFKGKESITRNIKLVDSEGKINFGKVLMPFKQVDDDFLTPLSKTFLPNAQDRGRFLQHLTGQLTVAAEQLPDAVKAQKALDALLDAKWAITDGVTKNLNTVDLSRLTKLDEGLYNFWAYEDAGLSLKNKFKVSNVLTNQLELSSLDPNDAENAFGRYELSQARGIKPVRALTWMFRNDSEGSVRDRSIRAGRTTMNELTQMFATLGPKFRQTASMLHPQTVKDLLTEAQRAAKKGTPFDNLLFMQNTIGMPLLYKNTQKALDVIKDIDLKKIKAFDPENVPDEEAGRSIEAWWAGLNEELKAAINEITDVRYGLSPELGSSLALQNGINSFVSKLFLERPAFAMRNWVTNKTLMTLDGMTPMDIFANSDAYHKEVWGEVEGAAQSFSNAAIGGVVGAAGVPIRGEAMALKVAFGGYNESVQSSKGIKKALKWAKGGGIPLIGGGLPGFFARDLSAYAEATDRFKVTDRAGHRWYRHLMGEPQIEMWFRQEHPDAYRILKDPSNGPIWQEVLNHAQNPSNVTIDNVIRLTQAASGGYVADVSASIDSLLIDMGFHGPHMKDLDLDVFKQQLLSDFALHPSSPLDPARVLEKAVDALLRQKMGHGRVLAAEAGLNLNRNANPNHVPVRQHSANTQGHEVYREGQEEEIERILLRTPFLNWLGENYPELRGNAPLIGGEQPWLRPEHFNQSFPLYDGGTVTLRGGDIGIDFGAGKGTISEWVVEPNNQIPDAWNETTETMSALSQRERSRVARMADTEETIDTTNIFPSTGFIGRLNYLEEVPRKGVSQGPMKDPDSFYVNGIPNRQVDLFTNLSFVYDRVFDKVKRLYAGVDDLVDYGEDGFVLTDEQIKSASDIAQDVSIAVSKPLRYLEQEIMMTLKRIDDPSVYKESQYGWIREMLGRSFSEDFKGRHPINIYKRKQDIIEAAAGRTLDPAGEGITRAGSQATGTPGPFKNTRYDSYAQKSLDDTSGQGNYDQAQDGQYLHKEVLPSVLYHVTDQADEILGSNLVPNPDKVIRAQTEDISKQRVSATSSETTRAIGRPAIGVGLTDNKIIAQNIMRSSIKNQKMSRAATPEDAQRLLAEFIEEDMKLIKLSATERTNLKTLTDARIKLLKEFDRLPETVFADDPITATFSNLRSTVGDRRGDIVDRASLGIHRHPYLHIYEAVQNPDQFAKALNVKDWLYMRDGEYYYDDYTASQIFRLWQGGDIERKTGQTVADAHTRVDLIGEISKWDGDWEAFLLDKFGEDDIRISAMFSVFAELQEEMRNADILKPTIEDYSAAFYSTIRETGDIDMNSPLVAIARLGLKESYQAMFDAARETLEFQHKADLMNAYYQFRDEIGQTIRGLRKNISGFSDIRRSQEGWEEVLRTVPFTDDTTFKTPIGTNVADNMGADFKNVAESKADLATDNPLHELVDPQLIPLSFQDRIVRRIPASQGGAWNEPYLTDRRASYMRELTGIRGGSKRKFEVIEIPKENIPDEAAIQARKRNNLREHLVYSDIPVRLPTNRDNPWGDQLTLMREVDNIDELTKFMDEGIQTSPVEDELIRRFIQGNRSKAKNGWDRLGNGVEKAIFLSMFKDKFARVTGAMYGESSSKVPRDLTTNKWETDLTVWSALVRELDDNTITNWDGTIDEILNQAVGGPDEPITDLRRLFDEDLIEEIPQRIRRNPRNKDEVFITLPTENMRQVLSEAEQRETLGLRENVTGDVEIKINLKSTARYLNKMDTFYNLLVPNRPEPVSLDIIHDMGTRREWSGGDVIGIPILSDEEAETIARWLRDFTMLRSQLSPANRVTQPLIEDIVGLNPQLSEMYAILDRRITSFGKGVHYVTEDEHAQLYNRAPFATAGEVQDISFMPEAIDDSYFNQLVETGEDLTYSQIEELIEAAMPPEYRQYRVGDVDPMLDPDDLYTDRVTTFGPSMDVDITETDFRTFDLERLDTMGVEKLAQEARQLVNILRKEAIKTHRRLDYGTDLNSRLQISGLSERMDKRTADIKKILEKGPSLLDRKPEEIPDVVQGIIEEGILDILYTVDDPITEVLNAETLLTNWPSFALNRSLFSTEAVNKALNQIIKDGKITDRKPTSEFFPDDAPTETIIGPDGTEITVYDTKNLPDPIERNTYAVVQPHDVRAPAIRTKAAKIVDEVEGRPPVKIRTADRTLMSPDQYDEVRIHLLSILDKLADIATLNRLDNRELRRDIDELAQFIDQAQQEAIEYAVRLPEDFLTITQESEERFRNVRRGQGRVYQKGKGRTVGHTIHNDLNDFFHSKFYKVKNAQGVETGEIKKGLVYEIENSTKEDGDSINGLNNIYERLGIDTRPITFEDPRRGQFLENSLSEAERLGMHTFSNQGQHAFESWLANEAPSISFLRRLQKQIKREMDPEDVRYASGSVESYVNRMNDYVTSLHEQWGGMRLVTELDEDYLRSLSDHLQSVRRSKPYATMEALPSQGVNYRGIPQFNTWSDFRKNNFLEVEEYKVGLEAITGNAASQSDLTVAIPTQRVVIGEGLTKDPDKARTMSPAMIAIRNGGVQLPAELREVLGLENVNYRTSWFLPPAGKRKKPLYFTGREAVLPANYGMEPSQRLDGTWLPHVPPLGTQGRVFHQIAPEGFKAVITDDSWIPMKANRLAIFVRDDASEEEIIAGVMRLVKYRDDTKSAAKQIGWEFRHISRGTQNWTGYQVSWQAQDKMYARQQMQEVLDEIESLTGDTTKSKYTKFMNKFASTAEAEAERGIRRRSLQSLAYYMQEQWEKGWPIYGNPKVKKDDILEVFINEQRIYEQERAEVIRRGELALAENQRGAGPAELGISPTFATPPDKSLRPAPSTDALFEGGLLRNKFSDMQNYRQGFMGDDDANKIINALNDFQKISNDRRRLASKLAAAQADWILHDYNNTNNMDYLVRWIGPWHIWQTRTTAKLAASLVENPHLLNRFTQFQEIMREINREGDTPTWAQMDLPIGQMAQPFFGMSKAAGIDPGGWVSTLEKLSEGSTMNIDAFLFWNDMFDYYPQSGSPVREGEDPLKNFDNFGTVGRAADIYSGILQMPVNPMYTAALTMLGQFGDDVDVLEKTIGSLTRPADVTLGATASLMGKHHRTQVIRTNRDIREIDWQYANTALNIILTARDSNGNLLGPDPEDNPQLQEHLMAWDLWSRRKHDPIVNIPLIHTVGSVVGELFGHELSEEGTVINPVTGKEANSSSLANIHSEMLKSAAHRRTIRDGTSILTGMPLNVPYPKIIDEKTGLVVDAGTVVSEYYDIVRRKGLNKKQKAKLYDDYFSENPWVRNWLANKKYETDPIKIAQARSMFFAGLDDINLEYNVDMQSIPERVPITGRMVSADPTSLDLLGMSDAPMDNFEYFTKATTAQENKRKKTEELKKRIFTATGINTGLAGDEYGEVHHSFGADKRSFGDPELFRGFLKENLINNESFLMLFGDNPDAGVQRITDVLDALFPDGIYKTVKREDVEASIQELVEEKKKQSGQDYDPSFVTVDMFNSWQFENHMQAIKKHKLTVVPPLFSDEFRDQYTIQGTNAADWTKYYADKENWDASFKDADPELFKMYTTYEAMSSSPESVVDKAIEDIMQESYDDINQIYALGLGDPVAIARAVDQVERMWKFPTVSDVRNWMESNEFGRLWRETQDYTESQLNQRIAERLETIDNITFADMRSGKYEEKIARTQTQLSMDTPFSEQYHWKSPNGERVIYNQETLDEFKEAYAVKVQLDNLKESDVYIKLDPTNSISHRLYYQYFIPDSDESIAMVAAIKTAQDAGQWETAKQIRSVLDARNRVGAPLGLDVPSSDAGRGSKGFSSTGKSATNINRKYQLYDLGQHAALSSEGKNIKALLTSKYYESTQPIPADYVFEHFARNGVASNPDIVDMWESIYPRVKNLYPDIDQIPAIRTLLQMTNVNGVADDDARIATYWYIDALAALIGQATGVEVQNRRPIRTIVQNRDYTTPRAAASKVTKPSTSGAGGLPTWSEVTRHIMMVFNDDSLEIELVKFFSNPSGNKLTKNHERMLRAMYKTFPIGAGYTFEQWVQALKLIHQTQSLLGLSTGSTSASMAGRNPYFQYPSSTPRMAKYRE